MKKSNFLKVTISLLLIVGLVLFQSCAKKKARKNIEGTWTYVSSTIDGEPGPITISGTYEFKACSGSDNRKGGCDMIQDLTLEYQGNIEYANATLKYKIYKGQKGIEMLLDDAQYMVSLSETDLSLTMLDNGNGETVTMNFVKQ